MNERECAKQWLVVFEMRIAGARIAGTRIAATRIASVKATFIVLQLFEGASFEG